jgi:hypothetical protein
MQVRLSDGLLSVTSSTTNSLKNTSNCRLHICCGFCVVQDGCFLVRRQQTCNKRLGRDPQRLATGECCGTSDALFNLNVAENISKRLSGTCSLHVWKGDPAGSRGSFSQALQGPPPIQTQ